LTVVNIAEFDQRARVITLFVQRAQKERTTLRRNFFGAALNRSLLCFLGVSRAPTVASDLLACEQGACTGSVGGFSGEQSTVGALLSGRMFGEFFGVDFGGVGGITQSGSLWIFFVDHGLGHGLLRQKCSATYGHLHHENATITLLHKFLKWKLNDKNSACILA